MRRLVDIDEVIKVAENAFPQEDVRKIMWVLCHTPTAYDVEKVVEQLEEIRSEYEVYSENAPDEELRAYRKGVMRGYEYSQDIVKRGGVE